MSSNGHEIQVCNTSEYSNVLTYMSTPYNTKSITAYTNKTHT
jgi:hypothetical protein